jgi:hypothetical protein
MRTLPVLLILAACSKSDDRQETPAVAVATPAPLASATQMDLAKDLDDAEARGTWREVRRKWTGQGVRWNVTRHRALCRNAKSCNVAAFPIQRPATHGWLPELRFADGQFAALEAQCGNQEACELTIEGTLEKLEVSAEMPTNVRIANARVVTTTAQR